MTRLYRVCVHHPDATDPHENGYPLYVWPRQGAGRIDDPEQQYLVLYAASTAAAAVAEALGHYPRWTPAVLQPPPSRPGSELSFVTYSGEPNLFDLDDPQRLVDLDLSPARVATRNRAITQAWAPTIYGRGRPRLAGIAWWSYYDPDWASLGYGTLPPSLLRT